MCVWISLSLWHNLTPKSCRCVLGLEKRGLKTHPKLSGRGLGAACPTAGRDADVVDPCGECVLRRVRDGTGREGFTGWRAQSGVETLSVVEL